MYDSLPKNEKTFDLNVKGSTTGVKYSGQFTVVCVLDIAGKHQLEMEKTRLMADYANPSNGLLGLAVSLATLRAKIISYPDWWRNSEEGALLKDENVILALYDKCIEMEKKWREELNKNSESATVKPENSTLEEQEN